MRTVVAAIVVTVVLSITACSIDVYPGDRRHIVHLPVYPDARPVHVEHTPGTNVTFTGRFSETSVVPRTFESDDPPEVILEFYRQILEARGPVMECRGTINVHRRRGGETLGCLERPSSPAVRLAGGSAGQHSIVAVTTNGPAVQFAVLDVHTRW